jgi:hypothetical protein
MLSDSIGYKSTSDVVAFFSLAFLLIYAITNTKLSDYKCRKKPAIVVSEEDNIKLEISSNNNNQS